MNLKTFGENETKQKNETKNVSPGDLEVGREYLIRAPGMCALGTYTGMASPPGDPSTGSGRELLRFWPVTWIRGAPDDPGWPVYAGPRATWRAGEVSMPQSGDGGKERQALTRGQAWGRFLAALWHLARCRPSPEHP